MIDVVVLGCGPIRTGEGAAAPFIGVHILGEDTLAESRWEDRIGPSIPVQTINHTRINRRGPLYANRPWDGTAALFVATEIGGIFDA